ncbi:MAG: STAS domain-containing protein [Planctomycetota bacterium]|jgi:anti-sigma B factor antagonist
MNDTDEIRVEVETTEGAKILKPIGDIDLHRAPSFRFQIGEAQRAEPQRLIVNLVEVPYMDSSGVATLIEAMGVARRNGSKLVLCAMQDRVRSVFEIARLDTVFTIVDGTEDAMGA